MKCGDSRGTVGKVCDRTGQVLRGRCDPLFNLSVQFDQRRERNQDRHANQRDDTDQQLPLSKPTSACVLFDPIVTVISPSNQAAQILKIKFIRKTAVRFVFGSIQTGGPIRRCVRRATVPAGQRIIKGIVAQRFFAQFVDCQGKRLMLGHVGIQNRIVAGLHQAFFHEEMNVDVVSQLDDGHLRGGIRLRRSQISTSPDNQTAIDAGHQSI